MSLYTELKDRKVIRVAAVYLVVAWLIMQVVAVVSEPLLLPDWFARVVILLLTIGFPLAIILSWAFDATPAEGSNNRSGKPLALGLIAATAIVIGFIVTGFNSGDPEPTAEVIISAESSVLPNSVAVLPLENLSPDEDNAYFAAGIHEEILNHLVKLSNLNVISRTSMVRYADSDLSIPEIAAELNVGAVMEGSVRYADDRVLVTLQLIDPETDAHLWSESYNREFADIFAIQADIAMNVANALQVEFSLEEQASIEAVPTDSPEAYLYYLTALGLDNSTQNDLKLEYFSLAIQADPEFATAYARRAWARAISIQFDVESQAEFEAIVTEREHLAFEDIEMALALDPNLEIAYVAEAWIHMANWRGTRAQETFGRVNELSQVGGGTVGQIASFYSFIGNQEEAIRIAESAYELDPTGGLLSLGRVLWDAGEIERSVALFKIILVTDPEAREANSRLATYEFEQGNSTKAKFHLDMTSEEVLNGNILTRIAVLAAQYAQMGFQEEAEKVLDVFEERSANVRVMALARVQEYLARGDEEQALYWLESLAEQMEPYQGLVRTLEVKRNSFHYPVLDKPEFVAVREKLGFTDL